MMAAPKNRYYPQLPQDIPHPIKEEIRYVRDALYDLRDRSIEVREFFLTTNINFSNNNLKFVLGKPLALIFVQDGTGGHTVTFDSTIKGLSTVTIDTRANTYSVILLYPKSDTVVYVMAGVTGGNL